MSIDVSKIRVGDEVTIRVKITALEDRDGDFGASTGSTAAACWFPPADIVAHVPKPRPFEAGDAVAWASGPRVVIWYVIAVHGKTAWLRTPYGGRDDGERLMTMEIEHLRHVDA